MSTEAARILVVEDNRDTSVLLRELLEGEGYQVESETTGEAALAALERTPDIDLIVLDLMLPGMSGYEVIERLRGRPEVASTPILVLSALSSPSARIRGLRDGADDYMTKPFLPEELLARTRTLVTARLLGRRTAEIQALEKIAQAALTVVDPDVLLDKMVEPWWSGCSTPMPPPSGCSTRHARSCAVVRPRGWTATTCAASPRRPARAWRPSPSAPRPPC